MYRVVLPAQEEREDNEAGDHERHESEVAPANSCATTVLVDVDLVPFGSTAGRR
jgi:hypothetical protein